MKSVIKSKSLTEGGLILVLLACVAVTQGRSYLEDVTLTSSEKATLDKFKDRMIPKVNQDFMKEDMYLIRWLRDNDFKLRDSERALLNHLQWRRQNNIDSILDEDWSEYEKDYRFWIEGKDKEGKPLLYFDVGTHDVRKAVIQGRGEEYLRFVYRAYENLAKTVRDLGDKYHNVTRAQLLINLKGYNIVQHGCLQCVPILLRMIIVNMQQYPGYVDTLILINTPDSIGPLLDASRQIATPNAKYFKVFGTNRKEWEKTISSMYDWDQLPPSIGGTKLYKGMDDE